jgi:uncharacterized membrane protein
VSRPLYDVLLVAHVVVAVVGFGALAVLGLEASIGWRSPDPATDESLRRFFSPGSDWPSRLIFAVPVLGLALLFGGDRAAASHAWPWLGLAIWVATAGLATGLCWPAERAAQAALAAEVPDVASFRLACTQLERGVAGIELCFVAAVVLMIIQPG